MTPPEFLNPIPGEVAVAGGNGQVIMNFTGFVQVQDLFDSTWTRSRVVHVW